MITVILTEDQAAAIASILYHNVSSCVVDALGLRAFYRSYGNNSGDVPNLEVCGVLSPIDPDRPANITYPKSNRTIDCTGGN